MYGFSTLDGFFGRQWESQYGPSAPLEEVAEKLEQLNIVPGVVSVQGPLVSPPPPTYPGAAVVASSLGSRMRFPPSMAAPSLPRYSLAPFHDPAAVSIHRAKMV